MTDIVCITSSAGAWRDVSDAADLAQAAKSHPHQMAGNGDVRHHQHNSQTHRRQISPLYQPARAQSHRQWQVSVRINNFEPAEIALVDPFEESEYKSVFEQYLRNTDRPPWSPRSLLLDDNGIDDVSRAEDLIQAYGETLLAQLNLRTGLFAPGAKEVQLYITERHEPDGDAAAASKLAGIHCLAWELLESIQLTRVPKLRLKVTRVADLPSYPGYALLHIPQPLAAVQADSGATFKILLVIARDFNKTGADQDPEPDLAQWPLMSMQKKLRSRLLLEVVRPGSMEELTGHLRTRMLQGVQFNLVHFDLHGRIMPDESGQAVPWLLFAKRHYATQTNGFHVPQTRLAKAEAVVDLLAEHQVENVVLNACLSAYNHAGSMTNLAHHFLRRGIHNISAMWFYVHWQTVTTYLDTFYELLLLRGKDFHIAAQRGREAIRMAPTMRAGRACQDHFLCVNYTRRGNYGEELSVSREPSPAPSAISQTSSTSNTSNKSYWAGRRKPSTPRLAGSLIIGDEPVMRMKLHLLELEYKLMTFRIVYASDLMRAGSDLSGTMERMVSMWLSTNMIDEVYYYKAKDFARRKYVSSTVPYRDKRSRASNGGYLQLLFPKPVKALRHTLHVIRDVDDVVDPGWQMDEAENHKSEERRVMAQEGLQRFARKLHTEEESYLVFLGSQDAQWWRRYLQHLHGAWWLHMPWSFTASNRYLRDESQRSSASASLRRESSSSLYLQQR